jgi:hypothetical protein
VRQRLDGQHRRGAGRAGQLDDEQADRSAADDRDARADLDVAQVERVDGHAERLQHGATGVADLVGQGEELAVWPDEELAQATVGGAVPGEPNGRAEVRVALEAAFADAARYRRVDGDPGSGARTRLDDPGELVAEHERPGQHGVADPSLGEPVQVRTAESDRGHADEAVPGWWIGRRGLVDDAEISGTEQTRGSHDADTTSPSFRDDQGRHAVHDARFVRVSSLIDKVSRP